MRFRSWLESKWSHDGWRSSDGSVRGDLDIDDHFKLIGIWNWGSVSPGQGNTVKALRELRKSYPGYTIDVCGAMDEAISYWLHIAQSGLVDRVFNTEDRQIYPQSKSKVTSEALEQQARNEYVGYYRLPGRTFEVWLRVIGPGEARITWLRGYGPGKGSFREVLPQFIADLKQLKITQIDYSTAVDDKTGGVSRDRLFRRLQDLGQQQIENVGNTIPAEEVLSMIMGGYYQRKNNANPDTYTQRFGVQGDFIRTRVPIADLVRMVQRRRLFISPSKREDGVLEKMKSGQRNPVIITCPEDHPYPFVVVDGNHSLDAAARSGDEDIEVIMPANAKLY